MFNNKNIVAMDDTEYIARLNSEINNDRHQNVERQILHINYITILRKM